MTLHDKIMSIPRPPISPSDCNLELIAFEDGHTTALKAAAKLAAEQDTLVEELVDALDGLEKAASRVSRAVSETSIEKAIWELLNPLSQARNALYLARREN